MSSLFGQPAPAFELTGSDGRLHTLESAKGQVTVLFFYVGDNTPTCRRQLVEYNDAYKALHAAGVRFMGISPDSEETHFAFTCRLDLHFPLLVDADRKVATSYGAMWPFKVFRRATFVLDREGIVRYENKTGLTGFLSHKSTLSALEVAQELTGKIASPSPAPKPVFDIPFS